MPATQTCTPSIATSTGSGAVSGSARPTACDDAAPVRVAAVQRGLDQRRVGDRARRALDVRPVAAAHDDAADALGALAVAGDLDAPAGAAARRAPGRRSARPRTRARRRRREAPEHIRIAVSLVDSWPSTVMRSNERLTHTPSSRSAVCGRQRRVGLHEAQHRGERRLDHPRALGLGGQAHGAAGQRRPRASRASRTGRWS